MCKVVMTWAIVILVFVCSSAEAGTFLITENGQRFYVETSNSFNWFEAIDKCTQLKMSLISMDSQNKTDEMNNLIKANFADKSPIFWTGGHDHNVSRHFEWISTGESFGFTNWYSGHPDNAAHHCVYMWISVSLKWDDYDCNSYKIGFVCEGNPLEKVKNSELALLKASLDNQTNLLKEKTEKFDSLQKELKNTKELQSNLKLQFDELKKLHEKRQEEYVTFQKSSEQQMIQINKTETELQALKTQISSDAEVKQMFKDFQKTQLQNQSQLIDKFMKSCDKNPSEVVKSTGNTETSNVISYETQALKKSSEFIITQLFGALQKSYELNANRTTSNKNYIFPIFNKNSN